ncbi:MAG: GNAT family N-acetyltransferase [Anaerolineales bacterium]
MMEHVIHTIDASNINRYGFFCYKSKPKTQGYRQKREWLDSCFSEGLGLKIIYEGTRSAGFVEYAPGEHTWRAIQADGYMVIQCMWVVGSRKGKGYGWRLLEQVISEAQKKCLHGVVVVSSTSTWLAKKGFFLHHGFEIVDHATPSFELLVLRFSQAPLPSFPQDWEVRLQHLPDGLVVYHSGQCPYLPMFVNSLANGARQMGITFQSVELKTSWEARTLSPSAYGTFGVVYNGQLLSYRPIGGKTLHQLLEKMDG